MEAAAPGGLARRVRKVRAAQGTVLDNVKAEQSDGQCNRKDTAGGGRLMLNSECLNVE